MVLIVQLDLDRHQRVCKYINNHRCDSFYEVSKSIGDSKKGCGIGRGNKISFGDKNKYPSPSNYQIKSCFSNKENKGFRMSVGRENIKYGGIFAKSETPEPGRYESNKRQSTPKYSMRSKLKPLEPSYKRNPGPGQCKIYNYF